MTPPSLSSAPQSDASGLLLHRCRLACLALAIIGATYGGSPVAAQESQDTGPAPAMVEGDGTLRFTFEGVPWRDVIKWIAEEADLALHVEDLPTGSFTYLDPNTFTHQEAIDRINLFLLPQGFTLVRSGHLLSLINLGDPRSAQQLDALAKTVTVDQLDQLPDHDVVRCFFPLGELKAEDAVQELSALTLMTTPAVFNKTNQLMITDTAGKLRSVKTVLDAFQPSELSDGTVVKSFALQHVSAEDVLVVARPHLGLATGEMIGIDVSLSADVAGKNIFVTGVEDKVKMIEGLITAIDKPDESVTPTGEEAELRSHVVEGGNVETVYNVLQTMLAGRSVRLSMDEVAGTVVALATPDIQAEIAATVAELQATDAEFEVIPLKTIDPYFAISLLEELLELPDALTSEEEVDPSAPKIDADPDNMRLFVHAKRHQIEQIKKIVSELDNNSGLAGTDEIRNCPLRGDQAIQILETAARFWRQPNPIFLYRSATEADSAHTERVLNEDTPASLTRRTASVETNTARLLTANIDSQAPAIRCQLTGRDLLLQSSDTAALDRFEEHLRTIAGPLDSIASPPVIFYLKYSKPNDAIRMLAQLLDGGESAKEGETGSLVNGFVSAGSSSSFLGSMVAAEDGTTTLVSGSITVVADSRLNRLIAQGTTNDIEQIEGYLKIIDKDSSITSVEVYGTAHVIELVNTRASEVAAALRDAYADRISSATGGGQPNPPGASSPADRAALAAKAAAAAKQQAAGGKTAKGKRASAPPPDLEPKMTIAVHEPSNSLIVTAPEQLFHEVEQLVELIDARSEEDVKVIRTTNSEAVRSTLQEFLTGRAVRRSSSSRSAASSRSSTAPRPTTSSSAARSKSGR